MRGGEYRLAVGTAGSATLVLQTVLPALMLAREPSRLTLEGGTHNPYAPPFDFLARTFLPMLRRMGASSTRRWSATGSIRPAAAASRSTSRRVGARAGCRCSSAARPDRRARASSRRCPTTSRKRELSIVRERLDSIASSVGSRRSMTSVGPGNVVMIVIESTDGHRGCDGLRCEGCQRRKGGVRRLRRGRGATWPLTCRSAPIWPTSCSIRWRSPAAARFARVAPSAHTRTPMPT